MAAYDEESVQWLYDKLQDGYDTGSIDEFKEDLKDDDSRQWYYNEATKMGLNLGDEEEFREWSVPDDGGDDAATYGTLPANALEEEQRRHGILPAEDVKQHADVSAAEKRNPQMFQQPEPRKPFTDEEEFAAMVHEYNPETPQGYAVTEDNKRVKTYRTDEVNGEDEQGNPNYRVSYDKPEGRGYYQTKESELSSRSRRPNQFGEVYFGWREGDRVKQLDRRGSDLASRTGHKGDEVYRQAMDKAETMSDAELIAQYNEWSKRITDASFEAGTAEGAELASALKAIQHELHARDLGYSHDRDVPYQGEADYRSAMQDEGVRNAAAKLEKMDNQTRLIVAGKAYARMLDGGDAEDENIMMAMAALYARDRKTDIGAAYNAVIDETGVMQSQMQSDLDMIYQQESEKQQAMGDSAAAVGAQNPMLTAEGPDAYVAATEALIQRRSAGGGMRGMLNRMTSRALSESSAFKAYYNRMYAQHIKEGMSKVRAQQMAANDVRNVFRDREVQRTMPTTDATFVLGSTLKDNMLAQMWDAGVALASGDHEGSRLVDEAYQVYSDTKASTFANIQASAYPMAVDIAGGMFVPANAAGEFVAKTVITRPLVAFTERAIGIGEKELMRRLASNLTYKTITGMTKTGVSLGVFGSTSALVRGMRYGDVNGREVASSGWHMFKDGIWFGIGNTFMGKAVEGLTGAKALAGEAGVIAGETALFTALDVLNTPDYDWGNIGKTIGSSLGVTLAGRIGKPIEWAEGLAARVSGAMKNSPVTEAQTLNKETRRDLEGSYPTICRLMSNASLAKDIVKGMARGRYHYNESGEVDAVATANRLEREWNQMKEDKNVPYEVKRKVDYVLNGELSPRPAIANFRLSDEGEDGTSYGETLDINGNVITRHKFKNDKERQAFEKEVSLEAERNRLALEEQSINMNHLAIIQDRAAAVKATAMGVEKKAVDDILDKQARGEQLTKEEQEVVRDVVRLRDRAVEKNSATDQIKREVLERTGLDVDDIVKTPVLDRTPTQHKVLEEYEQRLRGEWDETQDMSDAEVVGHQKEQSQQEGREATDEDKHRMQVEYEQARAEVERIGFDPRDIDRRDDEQLAFLLNNSDIEPEDAAVVMAYVNAKARYDGMIGKVREDMAEAVRQNEAEVDERTNKTDGKITTVTLRAGDKQMHVVGGRVVGNEDGTINTRESSGFIIVRDPQTGEKKSVSPQEIRTVGESLDARQVKSDSNAAIRERMATEQGHIIDGDIPFEAGQEYMLQDTEGKDFPIRIEQVDGETVYYTEGGDPTVYSRSRDELQGWIRAAEAKRQQQPQQGRGETPAQGTGTAAQQPPTKPAAPVREERPAPARMPMTEDNKPDWEKATPEMAYDYLKDLDNEDIEAIIKKNIERAQEEADKARDADDIEGLKRARAKIKYWDAVDNLHRQTKGEVVIPEATIEPNDEESIEAENDMQPVEEPMGEDAAASLSAGMSEEERETWVDTPEEVVDLLDSVAKSLGLTVRSESLPANVNGYQDGDVLVVNKDRGSNERVAFVMGHEMTHKLERESDKKGLATYDTYKDAALEMQRRIKEQAGEDYEEYIESLIQLYRDHHADEGYKKAKAAGMSDEQALAQAAIEEAKVDRAFVEREVAADMAGRMADKPELVRDLFNQIEEPTLMQRIKNWLVDFVNAIRGNEFVPVGDEEHWAYLADKYNQLYNEVVESRKRGKVILDETKTVTNMADVAAQDKTDRKLSLGTEGMVRDKLRKWAKTSEAKKGGWTPEKVDRMIEETGMLINNIDKALQGNKYYDDWRLRQPTIRMDWRDGEQRPVVTWSRGNIEYKYDMSADLLCINNEGMEEVLTSYTMTDLLLNAMHETAITAKDRGVFSSNDYGRLYEVMRDLGFTVPCPGCFDYAARLKMLPSVAQKFAEETNAIIDERNKNPKAFDDALKEQARKKGNALPTGLPASAKSREEAIRIAVAGDNITEHVNWIDFFTAEGQTGELAKNGGLFRAWQRTGAGRPKDKLMPEPWIGEMADAGVTTIIAPFDAKSGSAKKTPSFREQEVNQGTGLRRNSHSEFRVTLIIDEIQMLREAYAKNLTVFKYMKELDDVRLFGKLGVKYNMSFFPGFDKNGTAAGLGPNGEYIAAEESVGAREFPYQGEDGKTHYDGMKGREEAMKYCNENVSLSSIAFSIPHLIKLLTDVPTPSDKRGWVGSVIPFHSSGAETKDLARQGLGMARANSADASHPFNVEAMTRWNEGVTNFEQVQNDRFGEGWVIVEGKKAGEWVTYGHKMEFANGTHYYNRDLGIHLFKNGYVYDSELPDGKVTAEIKKNPPHPFVVDYNDKVREINSDYGYKEAADYYIEALREIGMIPRFEFEVPEEVYLAACRDGGVDPYDPKLCWKGEGHAWNPTDAESYYSLWCDYGMTDPETGKWSPHRPVGYIDPETGERSFKLPDNTVEIAKEGLERYSNRRDKESGMVNDAIREYARRSIAEGRMDEAKAREILTRHGIDFDGGENPDGGGGKKYSLSLDKSDSEYKEAVEKKDDAAARKLVDDAAKAAGMATDESGKLIDLYHGTDKFGFTIFDRLKSRMGAFFTSTRRNVAANYAGDDHYAGVRKINKGYKQDDSQEGILNNARSVFDQDWKMATEEQKQAIVTKVEADARKVTDEIEKRQADVETLPTDEELDIDNATAWVMDLFYTVAYAKENGNEGADLYRLVSDGVERYNENKQVIRDYVSKHYDELDEKQKNYLNYLTGWDSGDVAIDIECSYKRIVSGKELATVTGDSMLTLDELKKNTDEAHNIGAYHLFGNLGDNPLVVDAEGKNWYSLEYDGRKFDTDTLAQYAKENGYTALVVKNVYDYGDKADDYIFFEPSQLKSADTATYDDNGELIPLSKRFNPKNEDIRFSLSPEQQEKQTRSDNFKKWFGDWENDPENASKVVDEEGRPLVVYHQTNAKRWINRETGEDWEKLDWRKKMEWESRPQEEWEDAWEEQDFYTFDDRYARQSIEMPAIFFSPNNDPYHEYGQRTIAAYLDIKNPAINPDIPNRGVTDTAGRDAMEALKAQGYDGFIRTDEDGNILEYGVFDSSQVKSATENNGDFDPNNPDIRYSLAPTFYSNAAKAVEGVKQEKAKAEQWKAMLTKAGGIKAGEDKWMGLSTWLDEHKGQTLTKEEVAQFVAENGIQMEEVNYGDEWYLNAVRRPETQARLKDIQDKHRQYLDEAKKKHGDTWMAYVEAGERLDEDYPGSFEAFETYGDEGKLRIKPGSHMAALDVLGVGHDQPINETRSRYTTPGLENNREIAFVVPGVEPYQEHDEIHFGPENQGRAVMWVRFGEATDTEGNRVLVIDEVQSNRHQDAREKGYKKDIPSNGTERVAYEASRKEYEEYSTELRKKHGRDDISYGLTEVEREKLDELYEKMFHAEVNYNHYLQENELGAFSKSQVPAAPFEKNWHEVAMKRMLRLAAEEGFDKVAWTTGKQQNDRYNLATYISKIEKERRNASTLTVDLTVRDTNGLISFDVDKDGIITHTYQNKYSETVGKPLADVIGKEVADEVLHSRKRTFNMDEMEIGGKGMKSFYDQMLPQFMNKYGKRCGVKVGEVTLDTPGGETMHSVDVNEDMKRSVMQGQPLFSLSLGAPYQGSKGKIAKDIVDLLPKGERFVDLFSGGGAVTHAAMLSDKYGTFHMNDINPVGQRGFVGGINGEWDNYDREINTPEEFDKVRGTMEGIIHSHNYYGRNVARDGGAHARAGVSRMKSLGVLKPYADRLSTTETDYRDVELQPGDVVYADIPYQNTDKRGYGEPRFDKAEFVEWAQAQDVPVFVSEYTMPEGWTEIGSFTVRGARGGHREEKLWVQDKFADRYRDVIAENGTTPTDARYSINGYEPQGGGRAARVQLRKLMETVAANPGKVEARRVALRELNGQAGALRKAMSKQKEYDRWTVDNLIGLAKEMLNSGLYKGMSPYEVQRLVNMVNQGVGRDDITRQANTVYDIMMKHQVREWENQFDRLLRIRENKIDANGVRVQGALDTHGQRMVQALKSALDLDEETLNERINDCRDRMGSDDDIVAGNAADEMEGLLIAQQHYDSIGRLKKAYDELKQARRTQLEQVYEFWREEKRDEDGNVMYRQDGYPQTVEKRRVRPEFGGVDENGNRRPVSEENKAKRKRVDATVARIEQSMRETQTDMVDAYKEVCDNLGGSVASSITRAKEWVERDKERVGEIHHAANSDLLNVDEKLSGMDRSKEKGIANNAVIRFLNSPLGSFEKFMRYFGQRSAYGEGRLFNKFMRGHSDCTDAEWRAYKEGLDAMNQKSEELFGCSWEKLMVRMRGGAFANTKGKLGIEREFPPIEVSYWVDGKRVDDTLNQDEVAYLIACSKMTDGMMKLENMGIDENMIAQLRQQVDPKMLELADWYQHEFLPKQRTRINEVYKRMFGADMAHIDNYIHLNINERGLVEDKDINQRMAVSETPSTITGSLKERRRNVKPIDLHTSLLDLAMEEHQKMENWIAWAEYNRDLKDLLNYKKFKNKVYNMKSVELGSGQQLWDKFSKAVAVVTGDFQGGGKHSEMDRFATNAAKFVSSGCINFRVHTALKQLLSFPAFMSDARPDDILKAAANPMGSVQWAMENLPGFSKRWESRRVGDTRLMDTDSDYSFWRNRWVQKVNKWGMTANASVDCLTVAVGARAVYETAKRRYMGYGYDEMTAERKALQDAYTSYNSSQQSSEGAFVSPMQVERTFLSAIGTTFRNASMGYQRRVTTGARNIARMLKRGYKEDMIENTTKQMMEEGLSEEQARAAAERVYKRQLWHSMMDVANFAYALPFLWILGPTLSYMIAGDDEDIKEDTLKDLGRHAVFGSIEGLTFGGVMSELGNMVWNNRAQGNEWKDLWKELEYKDLTPLPLVSRAQGLFKSFKKGWWEGINDLTGLLIQSNVGVDPNTITDLGVAILDGCNGDLDMSKEFAFALLRILQFPQSQIDNLYIDELGLKGKDLGKYSYEELARRYARYKTNRAVLPSVMMAEDARDAAEDKVVKRFEEKVQERIASMNDEEKRRTFDSGDPDLKKMVGKQMAKDAGLDNEKFSKAPESNASERTARAHTTYQRIRDYADMAEDLLLESEQNKAKEAGDEKRKDAISKAREKLNAIINGKDATKTKGEVKGLGQGRDEKILQKLREERRKVLKELGLAR